mmetsp:Transcript_8961/g.23340  ORF Transcript_8961/g.23340 Transcript_8961/m.23340 type:complete len:219 (-) Transcript_8961:7-663(-)
MATGRPPQRRHARQATAAWRSSSRTTPSTWPPGYTVTAPPWWTLPPRAAPPTWRWSRLRSERRRKRRRRRTSGPLSAHAARAVRPARNLGRAPAVSQVPTRTRRPEASRKRTSHRCQRRCDPTTARSTPRPTRPTTRFGKSIESWRCGTTPTKTLRIRWPQRSASRRSRLLTRQSASISGTSCPPAYASLRRSSDAPVGPKLSRDEQQFHPRSIGLST